MGLKHFFHSTKADPSDPTIIGATKWNDDHYYVDGAGAPVGNVGALLLAGAAGALTHLNSVAAGMVLTSAGVGALPVWAAPSGGAGGAHAASHAAGGADPLVGSLALGAAATITIDKTDASASKKHLTFKTMESASQAYTMGIYSAANPFGTRRNQVLKWGYNFDPTTNARLDAADSALLYDIESFFTPDAAGTAMESHIVYVTPAGVSYRPFQLFIDRATTNITTAFASDRFSIETHDGIERFALTGPDFRLQPGTIMNKVTNNQPWMKQLNAAGSATISLAFVNNQNMVMLGDGNAACIGIETRLQFSNEIWSGYPSLKANGAALAVRNGDDTGPARLECLGVQFPEGAAPAAPGANLANLWVQDNGAGKTQLMVQFTTGAAVQLAIQP
jgi:hypothetical protein